MFSACLLRVMHNWIFLCKFSRCKVRCFTVGDVRDERHLDVEVDVRILQRVVTDVRRRVLGEVRHEIYNDKHTM